MNIVAIFRAAALGESLTPGQRALRKAVLGIIAAALVAFLASLGALTSGFSTANLGVLLGGLGTAFLLALQKYWTSHGDAPLASVAGAGAASLANVAGVDNDVVQELTDAIARDSNVPAQDELVPTPGA